MKLFKKKIITIALIFTILFSFASPVFAGSIGDEIESVSISEKFEEYINLSDEEKAQLMQPKPFDTVYAPEEITNPFRLGFKAGISLETKFTLQDEIPKNVEIKDQSGTNACWAFASLASLETTLAMLTDDSKVYDYSERHMEYATSRFFKNDEINERGFNRRVGEGGTWLNALTYLTNGLGAINESEMPFEGNEDLIDIEEIQNKEVVTRIYDTFDFPTKEDVANINDLKDLMKEHIKTKGAIYTTIFGAQLETPYYNNATGALYCDDANSCPINHAVAIIGWDDNYNVNNYNENHRPTSNGAWIVKNSWGSLIIVGTYDEFKEELFNSEWHDNIISLGWDTASKIPDEFIEEMFKDSQDYILTNRTVYMSVGDEGIMYISYEDVNVYTELYGMEKASERNYDYLYLYDELGPVATLQMNENDTYIANVFDKQSQNNEFLTDIALYSVETAECKVYVNPNDSSTEKSKLQPVQLKAGESEIISTGYHTLELAEPIKITGNQFVVVVEIKGTRSTLDIPIETKVNSSDYQYAKIESGKCFISFPSYIDSNTWADLSQMTLLSPALMNGDSTIKAFTSVLDDTLNHIEITKSPDKLEYEEGENFDKTGMIVKAFYNSNTSKEITNYTIVNGEDLKADQKTVTISYEGKTASLSIKVNPKEVTPTDNNDSGNNNGNDGNNNGNNNEKNNNGNIDNGTNNGNNNNGNNNNNANKNKAKNSSFTNASATGKNVKYYSFTDTSKKPYISLNMEVNNITKYDNDSYKYYYYLSSSQAEGNIQNWVPISELQTSVNKLSFAVNTQSVPNLKEVSTSKTLYLYIKEVATKGDSESVAISKGIRVGYSGTIEMFKDNAKVTNNSNNNSSNNPNKTNNTNNPSNSNNNQSNASQSKTNASQTNYQSSTTAQDTTKATTTLPATGAGKVIVILIVISTLGIAFFIRYEVLNRYVK